jgi:hypothetical protein
LGGRGGRDGVKHGGGWMGMVGGGGMARTHRSIDRSTTAHPNLNTHPTTPTPPKKQGRGPAESVGGGAHGLPLHRRLHDAAPGGGLDPPPRAPCGACVVWCGCSGHMKDINERIGLHVWSSRSSRQPLYGPQPPSPPPTPTPPKNKTPTKHPNKPYTYNDRPTPAGVLPHAGGPVAVLGGRGAGLRDLLAGRRLEPQHGQLALALRLGLLLPGSVLRCWFVVVGGSWWSLCCGVGEGGDGGVVLVVVCVVVVVWRGVGAGWWWWLWCGGGLGAVRGEMGQGVCACACVEGLIWTTYLHPYTHTRTLKLASSSTHIHIYTLKRASTHIYTHMSNHSSSASTPPWPSGRRPTRHVLHNMLERQEGRNGRTEGRKDGRKEGRKERKDGV